MPTKIQIINNALIRLGEPAIDSLTNPNNIIQGVVSIYDMIIEDSLAVHPWKFALKTATLTESPEDPITDNYSYTYNKPADLIQPWRNHPLSLDYKIQGNLIYSNINAPWKWMYVAHTEPAFFPEYFALYISFRLASEAAMLLTQTMDQVSLWESKAEKQLMKAQNRDATMQPNDAIQNNDYWADHFYGAI
tara:strand:+ start:54 stop:626 length:573 start_codon:yes stop_codon:yes gene_type:complete